MSSTTNRPPLSPSHCIDCGCDWGGHTDVAPEPAPPVFSEDCPNCGDAVEADHEVHDGDPLTCDGCKREWIISVDEDGDAWIRTEEPTGPAPMVSTPDWKLRHALETWAALTPSDAGFVAVHHDVGDALVAENRRLTAELESARAAAQHTVCAVCKVDKPTPWCDARGYVCASCRFKELTDDRAMHCDRANKAEAETKAAREEADRLKAEVERLKVPLVDYHDGPCGRPMLNGMEGWVGQVHTKDCKWCKAKGAPTGDAPLVLTPESAAKVEDLIANPRPPTQALVDLMRGDAPPRPTNEDSNSAQSQEKSAAAPALEATSRRGDAPPPVPPLSCGWILEENSGPGKGTRCGKTPTVMLIGSPFCAEHEGRVRKVNRMDGPDWKPGADAPQPVPRVGDVYALGLAQWTAVAIEAKSKGRIHVLELALTAALALCDDIDGWRDVTLEDRYRVEKMGEEIRHALGWKCESCGTTMNSDDEQCFGCVCAERE